MQGLSGLCLVSTQIHLFARWCWSACEHTNSKILLKNSSKGPLISISCQDNSCTNPINLKAQTTYNLPEMFYFQIPLVASWK